MKYLIVVFGLFSVIASVAQSKAGKTENVILITLDGYRWQELFSGADSLLITDKKYVDDPGDLGAQFWASSPQERRKKVMPFFWNTLASKGQLYGNRKFESKVNCSNTMWFSYPGYNEILSGAADDARVNSNDKFDNPNETVLEFLNNQQPFKSKVAAFGSWDVFPFIINTKRSGVPVNAGSDLANGKSLTEREKFLNEIQPQVPALFGGMRMDFFTHHYALEYLRKNHPKVTFISYGETDDFAHAGKYDLYLRSALQTDKFIEEIWKFVQGDPQYKDKTTVLITTDHGRGTVPLDTWRSHGKDIAGADQIWLAVIGPDTDPTGEIKKPTQLYQNQVAATVAALLGVEYGKNKKVGAAVASAIGKK